MDIEIITAQAYAAAEAFTNLAEALREYQEELKKLAALPCPIPTKAVTWVDSEERSASCC